MNVFVGNDDALGARASRYLIVAAIVALFSRCSSLRTTAHALKAAAILRSSEGGGVTRRSAAMRAPRTTATTTINCACLSFAARDRRRRRRRCRRRRRRRRGGARRSPRAFALHRLLACSRRRCRRACCGLRLSSCERSLLASARLAIFLVSAFSHRFARRFATFAETVWLCD